MKADHHAVVKFGAAATNAERQRANRFPIGAGNARGGANAEAVTQSGDDFDLLVAREDIHGGPNPSFGDIGPRSGKLTRYALYFAEWSFSLGPNPGVDDPGPGCFQQLGPT